MICDRCKKDSTYFVVDEIEFIEFEGKYYCLPCYEELICEEMDARRPLREN